MEAHAPATTATSLQSPHLKKPKQTKEEARRRNALRRKLKGWDKRFRKSLVAAGDSNLTLLPTAMGLAMARAGDTMINDYVERQIISRCIKEAKAAGNISLLVPTPPDVENKSGNNEGALGGIPVVTVENCAVSRSST